jgi:hypothetical protein
MNRFTVRTVSRRTPPAALLAAFLSAALLVAADAPGQQEKKAADPAGDTRAAAAAKSKAPAADDKLIAPFIGPDTFVVGRLDIGRVDVDVIEKYMNKMVDEMVKNSGGAIPPDAVKEMRGQMAEPLKKLREGLAEFTAAGGHHVYMLVDGGDVEADDGAPILITPLGDGANPAKLEELLREMGDSTDGTAAEIGKALVYGDAERIEAVKALVAAGKPAAGGERPDLAKAFAAAGADVPLRVALVPGEAARKRLEAESPTLPEEVGGGDIKVVSRGIRWAVAGVSLTPDIGMNLTVQAADAESAKALMGLFEKAVASVKQQVAEFGEEGVERSFNKQLEALKPVLKGDQITMKIDVAALQAGMLGGFRAEGEIDTDDDDDAPAEPAKPDDGGL